MRQFRFVTLDVFTTRRFAGNPLLVVPDGRGLTSAEMQTIAREINYSESTFVLPPADAKHAYLQRTFVPSMEIPYAGHPTIGTAIAMALSGHFGALEDGARTVTIEVGFGPIELDLTISGGEVTRVRMQQGKPELRSPLTREEQLRVGEGLGLAPSQIGELPAQAVSTGNRFLMFPVKDTRALASAQLDAPTLRAVEQRHDLLGVYLFAFDDDKVRARSFCSPESGVPEDPATGSAAGPLGIYLAHHRALPRGSLRFRIDQGIEMKRPSEIDVEVEMDEQVPTGVRVAGSAVLVMQGSIALE